MALNPLKAALQGLTAPLSPIMMAVQGLLDDLASRILEPSQDRGNPARRGRRARSWPSRLDRLKREDEELLLLVQAAVAVMA